MSPPSARSILHPERPLLLGATLLTLFVTLAVFVPTLFGHIAVMNAESVEVIGTDYTIHDDNTLSVRLMIHNPTRRAITFYGGLVVVNHDDVEISDSALTVVPKTVVHSGETKTVTVDVATKEGYEQRTRRGIASDDARLTGFLTGVVGEKKISVTIGSDVQ